MFFRMPNLVKFSLILWKNISICPIVRVKQIHKIKKYHRNDGTDFINSSYSNIWYLIEIILIQNTESWRKIACIKDDVNIHQSVEFRWFFAFFLINEGKSRVRNLSELQS